MNQQQLELLLKYIDQKIELGGLNPLTTRTSTRDNLQTAIEFTRRELYETARNKQT